MLQKRSASMEELWEMQERDDTSLGIIRPKRILRLFERPWPEEQHRKALELAARSDLFRAELKPLESLPHKFTFEFTCDDDRCGGHRCLVSDWEIYALYRRCRAKAKTDEEARQMVTDKVYGELCSDSYDMHFFMGTHKRWKNWMVVGLFYPKKPVPSADLFDGTA